jgi:hypothetical protein
MFVKALLARISAVLVAAAAMQIGGSPHWPRTSRDR